MLIRGSGSAGQGAAPAALPRAAGSSPPIAGSAAALTTRSSATRLMSVVERGLLVAGIVLFIFLVRQLGPAAVWANLRMIGWGFVLVIGQEGISYLANSTGWRFAFPPPRPPVRFRQLIAARLAGDAINNLTPTATLGGEVVRGRMLDGVVDQSTAWASIAIAKLMQTVAQLGFVFLGLVVVTQQIQLPTAFVQGLSVGLVLLTTGLLTGIFMQRRGMFTTGSRVASRIGVRFPERLRDQLARLDGEIARFYTAPGAFALSVLGFFVGWCMGIVEVYIVLSCLQVGATLSRAMTIEVLSVAIDALLFFVPAKAGTQEGGKVLIFQVLGLDPAKGLALGIVRRLRELTWSMIGLIVLARHHARQRAAAQ